MQSTPKSKSKNRISWPRIKVTNQSQRSGNFVLDDWFYAENKGHRLLLKKHTRGVLGVGTRQWQDVCVVGTEMRVTWSFGVHIMRSPSVRRACQGPSCVDTCVWHMCARHIIEHLFCVCAFTACTCCVLIVVYSCMRILYARSCNRCSHTALPSFRLWAACMYSDKKRKMWNVPSVAFSYIPFRVWRWGVKQEIRATLIVWNECSG